MLNQPQANSTAPFSESMGEWERGFGPPLPGSPAYGTNRLGSAGPSDALEVVTLADVETRPVSWLWQDRLARGYVALVAGDPGLGKSFLSCAVATAVTRGWALPGDDAREVADVLILSAEDGAGDTIKPRLEAMGADLNRVRVVTGVRRGGHGDGYFSLSDDLALLELELEARPAALVILDPLDAYLGAGVDSHKSASIRGVLGPVAALAERTGAAILTVQHLTKGSSDRAIYRPQGSIAYIATARTSLLVAADPDEPDGPIRHVVGLKNNLGPKATGLRFTLDGGQFAWLEGESGMTADRLLATPDSGEGSGALAEAEDALRRILADGPMAARDALEQCRQDADVSEATVRRARQALGVEKVKEGFGESGRWVWSLPTKALKPDSPLRSNPPKVSTPDGERLSTLGGFNGHESPGVAAVLRIFPGAKVSNTPPVPQP